MNIFRLSNLARLRPVSGSDTNTPPNQSLAQSNLPGWGVLTRRGFLYRMAGLSGAALVLAACGDGSGGGGPGNGEPFQAGDVQHILPSVTHERMLVKVSFAKPRPQSPFLMVNNRSVNGKAGDLEQRFFTFDISGLSPDKTHELQLFEKNGVEITSRWPLKTFPSPDADVSHLRLLCTTCPGGREEFSVPPDLLHLLPNPPDIHKTVREFQPMSARRKLLARAMTFKPDAMLVNGDSIYWDMFSLPSLVMDRSDKAKKILGDTPFRHDRPVHGDYNNEMAVKKAFGPQIAGLYGVAFRSTPTFFVQDDHDYGDNDETDPPFGDSPTFPPNLWKRDLRRFTQKLYYPELFAPTGLQPGFTSDLGNGLAKSYGQFRYGRLAEGLIYCCKVNFPDYEFHKNDLADTDAKFIPAEIEQWLKTRTRVSKTAHTFQMPSTPLVYTAGKWLEFYPDILDDDNQLTTSIPKPGWATGWNRQHDRILNAASARKDHLPLFFSGDIHASGLAKINQSNANNYSDNPIVALLVGTIGTGQAGFPSFFRGVGAQPSKTLKTNEIIKTIEQNGFSLVDFTPRKVKFRMFKWDYKTQQESEIETTKPFHQQTFMKPDV